MVCFVPTSAGTAVTRLLAWKSIPTAATNIATCPTLTAAKRSTFFGPANPMGTGNRWGGRPCQRELGGFSKNTAALPALRMVAGVDKEVAAAAVVTPENVATLFPIDSKAASRVGEYGITGEEWERLLKAGEVVLLKEGQLVVCEGEQPSSGDDREVFLLLGGECRGEVRGDQFARILPGDFVGEGIGLVRCIQALLYCM